MFQLHETIEQVSQRFALGTIRFWPISGDYQVIVNERGDRNLYAGRETEFWTRDETDARDHLEMMMATAESCSAHYID